MAVSIFLLVIGMEKQNFRFYFEDSTLEYARDIQRGDLFAFLDSLVTRYHQRTGSFLIVREVDVENGRVVLRFGRIRKLEVSLKIWWSK